MPFWESLTFTMVGALCGACGSLVVTGVVAWRTQSWIEGRERRNRRDDLPLSFYLKILDLILDDDERLAQRKVEGEYVPVEVQRKWFDVSHRLKLLGSQPVQEAYQAYYTLVYKEIAHAMQFRSHDPHEVTTKRERLIEAMAKDVQMA